MIIGLITQLSTPPPSACLNTISSDTSQSCQSKQLIFSLLKEGVLGRFKILVVFVAGVSKEFDAGMTKMSKLAVSE